MALKAGTMVSPNVRLLKLLGEGGMGSVWVADHLTLHTQVAVKFISSEGAELAPRAVARFKREAAAAARIKSPHVVQTFDHGLIDSELPYIVMELLEGETVAQRVDRLRVLPPRDVVKMVRQVALVLDQAHQLGIVHRDIKPDNLFLIKSGYDVFVKVLDFGIAKNTAMPQASLVTADDAMVGTPAFMSPEQIETPRTADHHVDLWALAVVAYYCFTGHYPFTGETVGSLAISISKGRFKPPSVLKHGLPHELDDWFNKALHRDIERRFHSAGAMAQELDPIIEGWMADFESVSTKRATSTDSFSELIPASIRKEELSLPDDTALTEDDAIAALSALPSSDHAPLEEIPVAGGGKTADTFGSSMATSLPRRSVKLVVVGAAIAVATAAGVFVAHTGGPLNPTTRTPSTATPASATTSSLGSTNARLPGPPTAPTNTSAPAATETTSRKLREPAADTKTPPQQPPAPQKTAHQASAASASQPSAAKPTATAEVSRRTTPAYCETDGFNVDSKSNLIPKPECLAR